MNRKSVIGTLLLLCIVVLAGCPVFAGELIPSVLEDIQQKGILGSLWSYFAVSGALFLAMGIRFFKATEKGVGLLTMISKGVNWVLDWLIWLIELLKMIVDVARIFDKKINETLDYLHVPEKVLPEKGSVKEV